MKAGNFTMKTCALSSLYLKKLFSTFFGVRQSLSYPLCYDNIMNNNNMIIKNDDTLSVCCCGCGENSQITRDEADEWTNIDGFMCHECE